MVKYEIEWQNRDVILDKVSGESVGKVCSVIVVCCKVDRGVKRRPAVPRTAAELRNFGKFALVCPRDTSEF